METTPTGVAERMDPVSEESWTLMKGLKKRTRTSPTSIKDTKKRQTTIKNYWLNSPVPVSNTFSVLNSNNETESKAEKPTETKHDNSPKSPPIYVNSVHNVKPLMEVLAKIDAKYTLKTISTTEIKIQPSTSDKYLPIVEELKKRKTEFYTFQRKQDKNYKVVLKNIHPSVDIEELTNEIEDHGHKVKRINNIKRYTNQDHLPLFFVEIETNANNKEIYKINRLMNTVVTIEPPRKKRDIPQCIRCQEFGHTKNYCHKMAICVKCAGSHLTRDCIIKEKTTEVKCANCSGDHPASYKGCTVRKQLQKKLFPALRDKTINQNSNLKTKVVPPLGKVTKPNESYAQVTVSGVYKHEHQNHNNKERASSTEFVHNNKLEEMMIQLMNRMDTMLNLLTCLINKISK